MSWLISKALMNSLSLPEPVEEYLGDTSLDGEQSVPLSGNPIPQAYCAPDKMTDFSRLSQFGMTFKPLTENLGEELLTLYLAAFHAKTSLRQAEALELTENEAVCGEKWRASFTKYDQDSSLWKTHQCSLLGDLDEFSETWPQWGLMRDGECWEQKTLEQAIRGTEFGLSAKFPTPDTTMANRGTSPNWKPKRPSGAQAQYSLNQALSDLTGLTGKPNPIFVEWLMGFPILWTDLKPWAMHKSHSAQQQHGES
jgi:hypothetical protein